VVSTAQRQAKRGAAVSAVPAHRFAAETGEWGLAIGK